VVSFEFSPETIARTIECVGHLSRLSAYRFNYTAHGHTTFELPEPLAADAFGDVLRALPPRATKWGGDVYAWAAR
jgi:hypothetical protein